MNRKALASFIAGMLLLLGVIILDRLTLRKVEQHSRLVEQTYEIISRLERLSNHFKSAQIYSKQLAPKVVPRFYGLYLDEARQVPPELDTLQSLALIPRQSAALARIRRDIETELPVLLEYNINELIAARQQWRLGKLYNIHAAIGQFTRSERNLLREHRVRLDRALTTTQVLSYTLPLLAFFIIGVTLWQMLAETRRRRALEKRLKDNIRELQRSNGELEQYAYVASHDLQEPLRKIRIFAGQLEEATTPRLSEQEQHWLARIRSSAAHMTGLIHDILNYSSLRNDVGFVPTDLNQVLADCVQELEPQLRGAGAEVTCEGLTVIDAIPAQLHQLFYNLLHNSLRFAAPGRPPRIEVKQRFLSTEEAGGRGLEPSLSWCAITVTDNGLGFAAPYSGQIFGLFKRLGHPASGTGIGLALCRKVAENHGGHIEADGAEGEGAVFHILLPVRQPDLPSVL